ncbi:MAG: hypothetical protein SFU86_23820 [Pirellulaceae bacterium]|nr:hypothetical protein [Pirellulaceae bacterium]
MQASKFRWVAGLSILAALLAGFSVLGQDGDRDKDERDDKEAPKTRPLPDDKRLLQLHLDFVKKAEQLGKEYEATKEWGKARAVYEEILKLVPQYKPASDRLAQMLAHEAAAKTAIVMVKANEGWQDSGIELLAGKPVTLVVSGTWTFRLEVVTNSDGLVIPKELRDFNPGCLIGMIPETDGKAKPFMIGPGTQFMAEKNGRLFLRMYDTDPSDNLGSLKVEVRGTFGEAK